LKSSSHKEEKEKVELTKALKTLNESIKNQDKEEFVEFLFNYLKENSKIGKENENENIEKYKDELILNAGFNKNFPRSLTQMSLHSLNVNEAVSSLISKEEIKKLNSKNNKIESIISTNPNSLQSLITQNLEIQTEILKIMMIGISKIGKSKLIDNFINKAAMDMDTEAKDLYIPTIGMDIKKIIMKILDKSVKIEFYDTDMSINFKETTNIFYKLCNSVFYIVDSKMPESFDYIRKVNENIMTIKNSMISHCYMFNLINECEKSTEFEKMISVYCIKYNITLINIKISNFNQNSKVLINIFSSLLIKKDANLKVNGKNRKSKKYESFSMSEPASEENNLGKFSNYKMVDYDEDSIFDVPKIQKKI